MLCLRAIRRIFVVALPLMAACQVAPKQSESDLADFCDQLPRAAYQAYSLDAASNAWFEVYEVTDRTYAIYEPWQWQEVISYLIVGSDRAVLFDTGNGIGDIHAVARSITALPVTVLNSHSHIDHIGGNHAFDNVLSMNTAFSRARSLGVEGEAIQIEVSDAALCRGLPDGVRAGEHRILPFEVTGQLSDGQTLDLGGRTLEVIHIPGHTDDSIALYEPARGLLWTGDTYYAGPIWLFAEETDLEAYRQSLQRLVTLVPELTALLPAHNTPWEDPAILRQVLSRFDEVRNGDHLSKPAWDDAVRFDFGEFGFVIRQELLDTPP